MDLIRSYIEALFGGLPKTKEVIEMKLNMMEHLEEKFEALLGEGKSENEAVGIVLSGIGSVEDLKEELGIRDEELPDPASEGLKKEYFEFKRKQGLFTAIAIALFILAPVMVIVLDQTGMRGLPIAAFFLCIAAGVALLIYFGIQDDKFKGALNIGISHQKNEKDWNKDSKYEAASGILWICTAIVFLLLGFLLGYWHPGWIVFMFAAAIQVLIDYWSKRRN